jgi:hypothetical protein
MKATELKVVEKGASAASVPDMLVETPRFVRERSPFLEISCEFNK